MKFAFEDHTEVKRDENMTIKENYPCSPKTWINWHSCYNVQTVENSSFEPFSSSNLYSYSLYCSPYIFQGADRENLF